MILAVVVVAARSIIVPSICVALTVSVGSIVMAFMGTVVIAAGSVWRGCESCGAKGEDHG